LAGGSTAVVAPAGAIRSGCDWQAAHPKTTAKIEIKRMVLSAPYMVWTCGDDRLARGAGCLIERRIKRQLTLAENSFFGKIQTVASAIARLAGELALLGYAKIFKLGALPHKSSRR
jgi:hypothetical protein